MSETTLIKNMAAVVKCENCGAEMDIHEECCPFCGYINQYGAEEKYMEKMQDIKANLAEVDDQQIEVTKNEAKKGIKIILITVIVILIIVGAFAALFKFSEYMGVRNGSAIYKEMDPFEVTEWNQKHLGNLEAMYEAGDIDGLVDYFRMLMSEDIGAFYQWQHSFMVSQASGLREDIEYMETRDQLTDLDIHIIMFDVLYYYNGDHLGTTIDETEAEYLKIESDKLMEAACKRFDITTDVLDDMLKTCLMKSGNNVDPQKVSNYCDKNKEIFKK